MMKARGTGQQVVQDVGQGVASLVALLDARCAQAGAEVALRRRSRGQWEDVTWAQAVQDARRVGAGLLRLGVHPGERVGVMSRTRYEWVVCDWGVLMMGGVAVALDEGGLRTQVRAQVEASGVQTVIVEDPLTLGRLLEAFHDAASSPITRIIYFDARALLLRGRGGLEGRGRGAQVLLDEVVGWPAPAQVISFDEVVEVGQARLDEEPACLHAARSQALAQGGADAEGAEDGALVGGRGGEEGLAAAVVFTAGTTGAARAVTWSHGNMLWAARALGEALGASSTDVHLLSVPLAHWVGRVMVWVGVLRGVVTALGEEGEDWMAQITQTKPSVLVDFSPRFEGLRAQIWATHRKSWLQRGMLDWALQSEGAPSPRRARDWVQRRRDGLARRWVLRGLRARFGERLRVAVSVGGALTEEARAFFRALGVSLRAAYGLAETSGITHISGQVGALDEDEVGVGVPLPGVEVLLSSAAEVLMRGPCVALSAQQRAGAWLSTGDLGAWDGDGALYVEGRCAHLIRLEDGRLINPAPIEQRLRAHPLVSQALIYGHGRPYLTALITLNVDALAAWAQQAGVEGDAVTLTQTQAVFLTVDDLVQQCNREHTEAEHVRKFAILQAPLSREAGELTASLQVRRAFAVARYRALIDSFYEAQF
jgi:long-chain acyl-CoA synthetase